MNFGLTEEQEMIVSTKGPKKRITAFLVDRGTPGFEIAPGYESVSHRGYKNMILRFDDCRLPDAQVLGEAIRQSASNSASKSASSKASHSNLPT